MIFSLGLKKIVTILGAFLFLGIIFLFLSPQKAQAAVAGYGWTRPQGSTTGACGLGPSAVRLVIGEPASLQAPITVRVREIDPPNNIVASVSGTNSTPFTGCVFDPFNHYIEVDIPRDLGLVWRRHYTKFRMKDPPSNWTNKQITFESYIANYQGSKISAAAWDPTLGEWHNYNPGLGAASFHRWPPGTRISRVTLDLNGPVSLDKEFNGSWVGSFIGLGVQPELSPSPDPTVADGWYQWGVFMNDNSPFFAVSAWSGFGGFGIDRQVPTVSCSINPSSPPNAPYTTTSVDVTVSSSDSGGSGLKDGELQVSTDGGLNWNTISNQLNGVYNHSAVGPNNTYEYRFRARDNAENPSGVADSWSSPYFDCGEVTIDDYPSPDLIIYYQENPAGTYNQSLILSSYKPPSTPGNREYITDIDVYLHGSVKNLGKTILAGTSVKVRVTYQFNPPLGREDSFDFTLTPIGDWQAGEVVPFGTACGDVDGSGSVDGIDVGAVTAKIGSGDPDYDLDDDGDVDGIGGDVDIATGQNGTTCTRDIKFTTPSVVSNPSTGDTYGVTAFVDPPPPDGEIDESGMPGGEVNIASEIYKVFEGGTMSISLSTPSMFMLLTDKDLTQVNFNWGDNPWDDNTTVELKATGLPARMTAHFNDPPSDQNPLNNTKINIGSQVSLDIVNDDVAVGDYNIVITATATQSVPYTQRIDTETFQIRVREAHPWFKSSIGGDVGAQGEIESKVPITAISSFTFVANSDPTDPDRTHRICHTTSQLTLPPPHVGLSYSGTDPYNVGQIGFGFTCRAYLNFDTSSIPTGVTIASAKLTFDYENLWTPTDFDVDLVEKDWPSLPGGDTNRPALDNNWHLAGDSTQTLFNTDSLNVTSGGGATDTKSVNLSNTSVINKGGISKFEIKANDEIGGGACSTSKLVLQYASSSRAGDNLGWCPTSANRYQFSGNCKQCNYRL